MTRRDAISGRTRRSGLILLVLLALGLQGLLPMSRAALAAAARSDLVYGMLCGAPMPDQGPDDDHGQAGHHDHSCCQLRCPGDVALGPLPGTGALPPLRWLQTAGSQLFRVAERRIPVFSPHAFGPRAPPQAV